MFVFSNGHNCIQELVDKAISWTRSFVTSGIESAFIHPRAIEPYWLRPQDGFVKLNTDGVVFSSRNSASIGGVIHDDTGNWKCVFVMAMGEGSIFQVEARAMLEGLRLAWGRGYRKVEVECNNSLLVNLILVRATDNKMLEVRLIHGMLNRSWDIRIRHVP